MIFNSQSRLHSRERKDSFKNGFEASKMSQQIKALAMNMMIILILDDDKKGRNQLSHVII